MHMQPATPVKADPVQTHVASQWPYTSPLISCRFDPKNRYVFSSAEDGTIQRWDLPAGNKISFTAHESWVFALGFSAEAGTAQAALIFTAILLHGACYDFLFIAGQLYVDEQANERIRGAAQGFIAFILWGVGAFVGTALAGLVMAQHKLATPVNGLAHDWKAIWLTPAWGALAVLVVFLIFFRDPAKQPVPAAKS